MIEISLLIENNRRPLNESEINIGQIFKDNKRNLIIIDRENRIKQYKNKRSYKREWYKYKCSKCCFEGWIVKNNLLNGIGCSCCSGKIVVEGINDIPTTAPWMVKYFQNPEDAKKYTKSSGQKIYPICPDCGIIKNKSMKINDIYSNKNIQCLCGDGFSYAEKLMFNLLRQLGVLTKTQYHTYWSKNKKFDFHFECDGEKYIIETHGIQHYEQTTRKGARTLKEEQANDKYKKELALSNGIKEENYAVIDCRKSELEWIKNSILHSKLNELFDLSEIDWLKAEEFALSNRVKEICNFKKDNPNITTNEIEEISNIERTTIVKYLKRGAKLGWCEYNPQKERERVVLNNKNKKPSGKRILCINTNEEFANARVCSENSEEIFGIKLKSDELRKVCRGERNNYYGLYFRYSK